jgi:flavorubredoxin
MDKPEMFDPYPAGPDIEVLPSYFPIPGLGILPVNAFVLKAAEPVLVDTGLWALSDEFMDRLSSVIDLGEIRWLWLTHIDHDHIGSLHRIIEAAPRIKVITTFLGLGKMSLFHPLPMDRVYLLNPGQSIEAGDRKLLSVRPPAYDAPETTGFYDRKAGAFFSSDCFGALMSEPADSASGIAGQDLKKGMLFWTKIDSPWLHTTDRMEFAKTINYFRVLSPKLILSSHLPAAHDMTDELLQYLAIVPDEEPFVGPDQNVLKATAE